MAKVVAKTKTTGEAKAPSVRELRRQATELVRQLSPERLRMAVEFLEFLKEREEWEATWEILSDPKMVEMIRRADERWRKHGKEAFLPWEEAKQDLR